MNSWRISYMYIVYFDNINPLLLLTLPRFPPPALPPSFVFLKIVF